MNLLASISTIMTSSIITVSENDPLTKLEEIFNENNIHHVPVSDKGGIQRMVSKTDFMFFQKGFTKSENDQALDKIRLNSYTVGDIMTKRLATMDTDDRINVALEVFKVNRFHAIPIMENGKLAGIVTTLDII